MQRHDRCAGAGGTASDTEGPVCAAQEEKKKAGEKKCRDWRVWVLGTEDDITRHAVSFLLGTEEEKRPPLSPGGADVRLK